MTIDRQGLGLTVLRIALGLFFLFQGLSKLRWFTNGSILAQQLAGWHQRVAPGSLSAQYLERVAIPYASIFARLIPLGELTCGLTLVLGVFTPVFAFIAFFMALNFQFAGGTLVQYSVLTNGYGFPVLGGTLALAIGGVRLPWSVRG
jgi:uncharacterized membrane protein YphA (DoxX/SURF4 family)